ncbi:MAG: hypothetical protein HY548_02500, partial [Elusimicrobia bacterium]|nr:hypothetical protein [Elusimicrobiota bacterium]
DYAPFTPDRGAGRMKGLLARAEITSGPVLSASDDGILVSGKPYTILTKTKDAFGNETTSYSHQTFIVLFGQAKLSEVTTASVSDSVDGSHSVTYPATTRYTYYAKEVNGRWYDNGGREIPRNPGTAARKGLMAGAVISWAAGPGQPVKVTITMNGQPTTYEGGWPGQASVYTKTLDAFGNESHSWSKQTFKVLAGQAKLARVETESISFSVDGNKSYTAPYAMVYHYYGNTAQNRARRRVGQLDREHPPEVKKVGAHPPVSVTINGNAYSGSGAIYSVSEDAFGNLTHTWSDQRYEVLFNQAKMLSTTTSSISQSIDGTVSYTAPYTMVYTYYGEELYARGRTPSRTEVQRWVRLNGAKLGQLKSAELEKIWIPKPWVSHLPAWVQEWFKSQGAFGRWEQDEIVTLSQDAFGNLTTTTSVQEFTVMAGQAKMTKVTTSSTSTSIDGTVSETKPYVTEYRYHGEELYQFGRTPSRTEIEAWVAAHGAILGQLKEARLPGRMETVSTDAFGNVTTSFTTQTFIVVAGQSKLKETVTESRTVSVDGSESVTLPYKTVYTYEGEDLFVDNHGQPRDVRGWSLSEKRDYAGLVRAKSVGQVKRAVLVRVAAGSENVRLTDNEAAVTLMSGQVVRVTGSFPIFTMTTDAFGNTTYSFSQQTFKKLFGQMKLDEVKNGSVSDSIDGSHSVTTPYTTKYWYYGETDKAGQELVFPPNPNTKPFRGLLAKAEIIGTSQNNVKTTTLDAFGNETISNSRQTFKIVFGQAKLDDVTTQSISHNVDGSETVTYPYTTHYTYWGEKGTPFENFNPNRALGRLPGLLAEAKIVDLAERRSPYTITLSINGQPVTYAGGWPGEASIYTRTVDSFGNESHSWSKQEFIILAGQAKLSRTETESISISVDGTKSYTAPYAMVYRYYGDTRANRSLRQVGQLDRQHPPVVSAVGAYPPIQAVVNGQTIQGVGAIFSASEDAFGNATYSWSNQEYVVLFGQAKLQRATTSSISKSIDGTDSYTAPYTTLYAYHGNELYGGGQTPSRQAIRDWIARNGPIAGQLKSASIEGVAAVDRVRSGDGSLVSVDSVPGGYHVRTVSEDAFGSLTFSYARQEFRVIAGQARMTSVKNASLSQSMDGTVTITAPYEMVYAYKGQAMFDGQGRLKADQKEAYGALAQTRQVGLLEAVTVRAVGTITVDPALNAWLAEKGANLSRIIQTKSVDAFGNVSYSFTDQTYRVLGNQAKLETTTTESASISTDGTKSYTSAYQMEYHYFQDNAQNRSLHRVGQLDQTRPPQVTPAGTNPPVKVTIDGQEYTGGGTIYSVTEDSFSNVTHTWAEQTYTVLLGQAKLSSTTTSSISISVDGTDSYTAPYITNYAYHQNGPLAGQLKGVSIAETITLDSVQRSDGQAVKVESVLGGYHVRTVSEDAFDNVTYSYVRQEFQVVAGQAKLMRVDSASLVKSADGSVTLTSPYAMTYRYKQQDLTPAQLKAFVYDERRAGRGSDLRIGTLDSVSDATVQTVTFDVFGNKTYSSTFQNFEVHQKTGQAKLMSTTMSSFTESIDGGKTYTAPYTTVYFYHDSGLLKSTAVQKVAALPSNADMGAYLAGLGITRDSLIGLLGLKGQVLSFTAGEGGRVTFQVRNTQGRIIEGEIVLGGVLNYQNGTYSQDVSIVTKDGDKTTETTITFTGSTAVGIFSITGKSLGMTRDQDGNVSILERSFTYGMINGLLRITSERIDVDKTVGANGDVTVTDPYLLRYSYTKDGELTRMTVEGSTLAPSGNLYAIHSVTTDAFGNVTESWTNQEFKVIAGQARLIKTVTESKSVNVDGTESRTYPYVMEYNYVGQECFDDEGRLIDSETYEMLLPARLIGQMDTDPNKRPVVRAAEAVRDLATVDARSFQPVTIAGETYNPEGAIYTRTEDAFGNVTHSWSDQEMKVIDGQAQMKRMTTTSISESADGTKSVTQPYVTEYSYYMRQEADGQWIDDDGLM